MNYTPLKQKLLEPGVLALADDDARKDFIELKNIDIPISSRDAKAYIRMSGLWLVLKNSTADSAKTIFDALIDPETEEFDITDSATKSFFEASLTQLIADVPEVTIVHKNAIMSMGENKLSWAEINNYKPLRIGYFQKARALQ